MKRNGLMERPREEAVWGVCGLGWERIWAQLKERGGLVKKGEIATASLGLGHCVEMREPPRRAEHAQKTDLFQERNPDLEVWLGLKNKLGRPVREKKGEKEKGRWGIGFGLANGFGAGSVLFSLLLVFISPISPILIIWASLNFLNFSQMPTK